MLVAPVARTSRESSVFSGGMSPTTEPRGFAPLMTISSSSPVSSVGCAAVPAASGGGGVSCARRSNAGRTTRLLPDPARPSVISTCVLACGFTAAAKPGTLVRPAAIVAAELPSAAPSSEPVDVSMRATRFVPVGSVSVFTLLIIIVLIYLNTKSVVKTAIVLLAVPFSLVGAFWLLYLLDYNLSTAVWVGIIALAGLDAETGVVMLLYLDHAWERFRSLGRMNTMGDLQGAVIEGAVQRIRPKIMTVCAILFGLLPIMWSPVTQAGADVMKRIAAPMIGGVVTSGILELLIYPVIYVIWRRRELPDIRRLQTPRIE